MNPVNSREHILKESQSGSECSIILLLELLILDAYLLRVSDIHIDPTKCDLRVRLRCDGLLNDEYSIPLDFHHELISRLKILAGARTDEHFIPHDGRFKIVMPDSAEIDVRLSIIPTHYGENAVLRLLLPTAHKHTLSTLGMSSQQEKLVREILSHPNGLILVTGPTGSGKTTTLYTLVQILSELPISIVSIEDPVEYSIPGVCQIQVREQSGLGFVSALRSVLRQDPDAVMVGEIRDKETAGLVVHAALTGHIVLSTLHTNNSVDSLLRLIDMGIEPYLISSTVRLVIAQRLVRRLCNNCKEILNQSYVAVGCKECSGSGYSGRIGIFELLLMDAGVIDYLNSHEKLSNSIHPLNTLFDDGLRKVALGLTTIEEISRLQYA